MASINSFGGKPERSADFTIIMNFMFASPFVLVGVACPCGLGRTGKFVLLPRRMKLREIGNGALRLTSVPHRRRCSVRLGIFGEAHIHLRRLPGESPWPTGLLPAW